MSLLVIALAGGQIWEMCVDGLVVPEGGISLIGDASKGFHVIMQAVHEPLSATNSSLSQSPAISVSKRAMRSRSDVESSAESRGVETRHQSRDSSLTLVHPVSATNSTSSVTAAWSHPVHCFDARVAHLQPALSSDCIHLADQVRDNVFNPYVQFTFGFTDAADINLSRPEFQKWWYGQCMVSLRNFDKTQIDTFRFIDVIVTARRINQKCVADRAEMPLGGTASVGALGRLFYVYLGAPVASDSISSGVTLSRRRTGVNSLQR